jgi:hypothetical protein
MLKTSWDLKSESDSGLEVNAFSLPDSVKTIWRIDTGRSVELATSAWVRACGDLVWAVQDGYELIFHVGDRARQGLRSGHLSINSSAAATLVTDVRCALSGAVWVEGYAFGVSGNEPLLRIHGVPATRFSFSLDRYGVTTKRDLNPAQFDILGLCTAPANEQQMFCSEAKKAVGW